MPTTTQQALKWRWLSPKGIQAVAVAASPTLTRAGRTSSAVFAAAPAWTGSFARSLITDENLAAAYRTGRPCTARRLNGNGSVNCTGNCKAGIPWRHKVITARTTAIPSFASKRISITSFDIHEPGQLAVLRGGAAPSADAGMMAQSRLDHGARRVASFYVSPTKNPHNSNNFGTACGQPRASRSIGLAPIGPAAFSGSASGLGHSRGVVSVPVTRIGLPLTQQQQCHHRHHHHCHHHALKTLTHIPQRHSSSPSALGEGRGVAAAATAPATAMIAGSRSGTPTGVAPAAAPTPAHEEGCTAATAASASRCLPTRHIVAAVDPDLKGALALVYWDEDPQPAASGSSCSGIAGCSPAWQVSDAGWLLVMSTRASELWPGGERGSGVDDGMSAAVVAAAEVQYALPPPPRPPPPPPSDPSRWTVRVWDMPVSAAERQKPTATGGVSRRRLLHVAGARAVLASALSCALPPPEECRRVALYGYVEVPPILPGDGNISAYTSLWSTGAWLGLLTGMGFTVGSTPVRRWKQDLGLYGARSKDAGLVLARMLFPNQARILKYKKDHGRADALLIAAWALGASLPPRLASTLRRNRTTVDELLVEQPSMGLAWGAPRAPTPTDAYGNLLTPERDMLDEIDAAEVKLDRVEGARAAKKVHRAARGKLDKDKPAEEPGEPQLDDNPIATATMSIKRSSPAAVHRPRKRRAAAAEEEETAAEPEVVESKWKLKSKSERSRGSKGDQTLAAGGVEVATRGDDARGWEAKVGKAQRTEREAEVAVPTAEEVGVVAAASTTAIESAAQIIVERKRGSGRPSRKRVDIQFAEPLNQGQA